MEGFSHVLGYTGKITQEELNTFSDQGYLYTDTIGKTGLEQAYESLLRGTHGIREIEVDVSGRLQKVLSQKDSVHGKNIKLSIDARLQEFAYSATQEHLRKHGKEKASVIVMNPTNGQILSMVTYPEFDANKFSGGISYDEYLEYLEDTRNPLFNRSIKGEYPSGSTIKLLIGAAALEEKVISESTRFLSTGGLLIANTWFFPDWRAGGHGYVNIIGALADSVNTFFYIIGGGYEDFEGLGLDRIASYYRAFGLGERTGIDLPGESRGLVPTREWKWDRKKEEWYIGDTYHMSIGQGDILVTPLQVAQYTAYFANNGITYVPRLVESIIDEEGIEKKQKPEIAQENVVSQYTTSVIRKGMREAVLSGSAQYLTLLPVTSAGKTGTAQFSKVKDPHAWFTAFAPYENPEIVITVLVEEGEEGSSVGVQLAYQIMNYYFGEYKELTSDE
jgi:penicillin-binding protein 2